VEEARTVERVVREQLSRALGGVRGMLEGAVPTIGFTGTYLTTHQLRIALAVLLLVARVVQRQTPQFVLNSLVGIAIAAVFALRSGEARDFFLPGLLYNSGYAVALVLSIAVGWPLLGFLIGSVTGDPTAWHQDKQIVRLCSTLTWLLAIPCIVRVAVQLPLYLADLETWLGVSKVAMGWPLQVAALAMMVYVLGRNHTPIADTA
jgi:MFS family permease